VGAEVGVSFAWICGSNRVERCRTDGSLAGVASCKLHTAYVAMLQALHLPVVLLRAWRMHAHRACPSVKYCNGGCIEEGRAKIHGVHSTSWMPLIYEQLKRSALLPHC
jgi:hypothetical protein